MYEPLFDGTYPLEADRGRDVRAGNLRGWALEYTDIVTSRLQQDEAWQQAVQAATERGSLLNRAKMANLYLLLKYAIPAHGPVNIIEFGSYRGGGIAFFATLLRALGRRGAVYAMDTFEGMPTTDGKLDLHGAGDFNDCDFEGLQAWLKTHELDDRVELVKGRFEDTLPGILRSGMHFSLVHCDCDIYSGVKYVCQTAQQLLVPGGHLVFDDPLHGSCLGAFLAIEEELIQERRMHAEQVFPHLVYRFGMQA